MKKQQFPLVSVCMITYGHQKYIEKAIDGVLMQKTDFNFELNIFNDCSPDNTELLIQNIIISHPNGNKIRYNCNHVNLGAIPNFHFALSNCNGKFIALCEGDDFWTDSLKLQKQVDFLRLNKEFVISFHDVSVISSEGEIIKKGRLKNNSQTRSMEELVGGAHLPTSTVCFRNVIKRYPQEFNTVANGDSFLFALLGHYGPGYRHYDIGNSYYRLHAGGVWSGKSLYDKFMNGNNTFEQILKISDKIYYKPLYRKLMSINFNLIKKAPDTSSRLVHFKKMIHYSWMYFITK